MRGIRCLLGAANQIEVANVTWNTKSQVVVARSQLKGGGHVMDVVPLVFSGRDCEYRTT